MVASPLVLRIVDRVRASLPATVQRSVSRTWREVPAYANSPDRNLASDLTAHTETVFEAALTPLEEGRRATAEDFPITASQARRRLRQGVTLPDFLTGFRIGQETLWEAIVEASDSEQETRDEALHIAIHVMSVIEVGSSVGAVAYLETQQLDMAEGDRVRRDLVDDLLSGRRLAPGPSADLAEISDLGMDSRVLVATATAQTPLPDEQRMREVISALRSVFDVGRRGIAVVLQDQIVGITPVTSDGSTTLADLERVHRELSRHGTDLCVGTSTIHEGLHRVPEAYREAVLARESLDGAPGVRSLNALTPLDYLVTLDDEVAHRLIRPELRRFVEDDLAAGGVLIATLLEYAACDLNAKLAAEHLHVHVNTAYYRLDTAAERTGRNVRSFTDLQETIIAIRMLTAGELTPSHD
ncbi:PucR family transcriptional regulator [Brevibacterium atlanticum]|uniref:PucR family transcriptional regulator n=1 Tax=Brevibacterium atlanticum TaxID=2697563 RepID=UPI00141E76ED|nr:helix-turn-helix domain-containing protein [Brevibacterium atlanticum]